MPTLAALEAPSLWIFGGEDHSMPTGWTLDRLDSLRAAGRPIRTLVYDDADHGILLFEEADGERTLTGYAPGYFAAMVAWLHGDRGQSPPR
ncbi:MAG: hypothetical protein GWN71_42150 [Gammaproteobacteria bacterium]|nr:dienelactone hydrolase family protein [Gemmatimonadota bacterium]NIU79906.1 hypothetical protein [Gammaproteobacteria bacterium]NIY12828.1 hypothetical protein [Gemmatimonadota bacterium]